MAWSQPLWVIIKAIDHAKVYFLGRKGLFSACAWATETVHTTSRSLRQLALSLRPETIRSSVGCCRPNGPYGGRVMEANSCYVQTNA